MLSSIFYYYYFAINTMILTIYQSIYLSICFTSSRIKRYLGPIQLYFVKDSPLERTKETSLDKFIYSFTSEANAAARAHVRALGGNGLVSYSVDMAECGGKLYRNHIICVKGDAVLLEEQSGQGTLWVGLA